MTARACGAGRAMRGWLLGLAASAGLALTAAGAASAQDKEISIYFVGCAAPTGFHGYLARGAEEAGKNLGVKVTYVYPDQLTIPNQVQKIEEAIAAQANGIAICAFAEDSAYADVVARAKEAGIAFGSAAAPPSGAHRARPQRPLPVPHRLRRGRRRQADRAAPPLDGREGQGRRRRTSSRAMPSCQLRADLGDRRAEEERRRRRVPRADHGPGPAVGGAVQLPAPQSRHRGRDQHLRRHRRLPFGQGRQRRDDLILTGYDIVAQSLEAIKDGRQAFTIDQQQFWRGYMPVAAADPLHQVRPSDRATTSSPARRSSTRTTSSRSRRWSRRATAERLRLRGTVPGAARPRGHAL